MRHDHTFSLTPDQLSWQHSLALGSSLPVGKSCELNCAILTQPLSQNPPLIYTADWLTLNLA